MLPICVKFEKVAEIVYLPAVDQELKKTLATLTKAIERLPVSSPSSSNPNAGEISQIQTDLKWHRGIGWGIAGIYAVIFLGAAAWLINTRIPEVTKDLQTTLEAEKQKNEILRSTTAQFDSISTQLAVLTATVELRRPDAQKVVGQSLKDRATGQGTQLTLNLRTADQIAKQALAQSIRANPADIGEAGASFVHVADTLQDQPQRDLAWQVVSQVINYRSFLFSSAVAYVQVKTYPPCGIINAGDIMTLHNQGEPDRQLPPVKGNATHDCALDLDHHPIIKGMTCTDCLIRYSGGPLSLEDDHFIRPVFVLSLTAPPGPGGAKLTHTLLTEDLENIKITATDHS